MNSVKLRSLVWPCFTICRKVLSRKERLILNIANETVWTFLFHKVPGAPGTDHWGWTWRDVLCFCTILVADTSWHNQVIEMVKALGYSLCSPPHYSTALFRQRTLKYAFPYQNLLPLPSPQTQRILHRLIHNSCKSRGVQKTHKCGFVLTLWVFFPLFKVVFDYSLVTIFE